MTSVALRLAGGRSAAAMALSTRLEASTLATTVPRKSSTPGPSAPRTSSSAALLPRQPPGRSSSCRTETFSTASSGGAAPAGRDATTSGEKSSADSEEVGKFSSMAGDWWDHRSNPLIGMNPTRVSRMVHVLNNRRVGAGGRQSKDSARHDDPALPPLVGMRALDVGCGGGLLSESLARLGADVTAIDPSEDIVDAARRHTVEFLDGDVASRIDYRGGTTVEDLADELVGPGWRRHDDASGGNTGSEVGVGNDVGVEGGGDDVGLFDVICILEVLEHAPDPARLLTAASSLLKRRPPSSVHCDSDSKDGIDAGGGGGTLFVSTINRTAKSYLLAVVGAEYLAGMLPPGTHDWNRFLSPEDVERMAKPLGLDCMDLCGMVPVPELCPPPTSLSLASIMRWKIDERDTDVNWIAAYAHR